MKWLGLAALLALFVLACWVIYKQWMLVDVEIPAWGWAFMALGVGMSLVVGLGLMALMFYSSRQGYDEEAATKFERDKD